MVLCECLLLLLLVELGMGLVKLIPFVVLTSAAIGIIIELGPLSSVSMVRIGSGSVNDALFNLKSDFRFKGEGDRDFDNTFVSIFLLSLIDAVESNRSCDGGSLKFSMSNRSFEDGVRPIDKCFAKFSSHTSSTSNDGL